MSRRMFVVLGGLLGLLVLACSSSRPKVMSDTRMPSPQELMQRSSSKHVNTLRATGSITIESRDLAATASCEVRLKRPDSLFVKLSGPFGIGVAKALVTRNDFVFFNSYENKVFTGETSQKNLRLVLRFDASFDDVLDVLSGTVKFDQEMVSPEVSIDEQQYLLLFRRGDTTTRYWIDPEHFNVSKYQLLNSEGRLITEKTYAQFKEYDGVHVPRSIRVVQPMERQSLSMYYDTIELNGRDLDFALNIPEAAERIHLETSSEMK